MLEHVVEEERPGDALADRPPLHVGERHHHRVDGPVGDAGAQGLQAGHAELLRLAGAPSNDAAGLPPVAGRAYWGHGPDAAPMSPGLPLVGVTTYYAEAAWGPWQRPAGVVPAPYFELVAAAGARPLLLAPCRSAAGGPGAGAPEVVRALDALVLVGGGDVDPGMYGAAADPALEGVDAVRDQAELALLAAALDQDLPVLAICRGLQLLNVHLGGTLHRHLPDVLGHGGHRPAPGAFADIDVEMVPGTRTAAILGGKDTVRCSHHQAIDRLGDGLVVAARSLEPAGAGSATPPGETEGVVEAAELAGRRFVLGVQWHPEESGDRRLFDVLIAAAG